jgi:hypothetical protein
MTEYDRMRTEGAPDPGRAGPQEERLQALFTAADPQGEPSEKLVRRVSELAAQRAAATRHARGWWPLQRSARDTTPFRGRRALRVARWCVAGVALAALISFWPAEERDVSAVAAAVRATTAAPALHVVGRGTKITQELWFVQGAGVYLYGKNPQHETILVDDMKHYYRYEIRERRVYVTRSLMADPKMLSLFWENHSGAGLLKQLLAACGPKSVSLETIRRDGRLLRQIIGPRRVTRITIDPETDRILATDVDLPHPDGTRDWARYDFDYPDPATVDRSHFQFHMPRGVSVVDQTGQP